MIGNSNEETKFLHKFLLANRQVLRICKALESNSSANTKLWNTQSCKIMESGAILGELLGQLLKNGLPLMKYALKPLVKSVLIQLGLAASATDAAIQKKLFGLGMAALIILNEEMNYIMKIAKYQEESGLLIKMLVKQ